MGKNIIKNIGSNLGMERQKKNEKNVKKKTFIQKEKAEKIRAGTIGLFSKAMSALGGNETRLKIAMLIKNEQKITFTEIKTELNLNSNSLRFHLKKLQEAQLVSQSCKRGTYRITELGMTTLKFFELLEKEVSIHSK